MVPWRWGLVPLVAAVAAVGGVALGPARSVGAQAVPAPNDPLFKSQWNLRAIGIPDAWSVSTGVGATVAILDTGVAYEDVGPYKRAPDLAGTRFVPGWDFVDNTAHPDDRPTPGRPSHGTHLAGTVAQTTGNGLGAAGVAPGVAIMPIRVLAPDGTGTGAAVASGLRFAADHGANVANLSLGNPTGSPELADAVAYALGKGVTVVASSGDEGNSSLTYPAAYAGVIAVGAVRFDKTRPAYSSYGAGLALVAPGGDLTVDQDGDGLDDGIVQQTLYDTPSTFCFCFLEGTSSAAAHVSAAAALLIASGRATTPAAVRAALVATAEPLGPAPEYGAGLLRIDRALGVSGAGASVTPSPSPSGPVAVPGVASLSPISPAGGVGGPSDPGGATASHLPTAGSRFPGTPAAAVGGAVAAGALVLVAGHAARRRRRTPPRPPTPRPR